MTDEQVLKLLESVERLAQAVLQLSKDNAALKQQVEALERLVAPAVMANMRFGN